MAHGHTSAAVEALLARLRELPVVPAVRSLEDVEEARRRGAAAIFFFKGDVFGLREALARCGDSGIPVYVHLDLVEGVGKDAAGIRLLRELGAAGVVSTRGPLLREARAAGLLAIHRVFMVDSEALRTGTAAVRASEPDLVEVTFLLPDGSRQDVWVNNRLGLVYGLKEWYDANLPWTGGVFLIEPTAAPDEFRLLYSGEREPLMDLSTELLQKLLLLRGQAEAEEMTLTEILTRLLRDQHPGVPFVTLFT
ncbi:MAG: glycerol-3-phosphate responsive antiterminator, partial [Firmicutes bacterium]|nr:glycerol-3-phosphate responsive antiterminator [Bacillota bacterium]